MVVPSSQDLVSKTNYSFGSGFLTVLPPSSTTWEGVVIKALNRDPWGEGSFPRQENAGEEEKEIKCSSNSFSHFLAKKQVSLTTRLTTSGGRRSSRNLRGHNLTVR